MEGYIVDTLSSSYLYYTRSTAKSPILVSGSHMSIFLSGGPLQSRRWPAYYKCRAVGAYKKEVDMFGIGKKRTKKQVVKEYQYRYTMNRDMDRMEKKGYTARAISANKPDLGGKFSVLYVRETLG